jgi:hypothetical protein
MITYIVTAYRWGYLNDDMVIYASPSKDDCIDVAEAYADYRGGKYGCAVIECLGDIHKGREGEGMGKRVFYTPSQLREKEPKYNHRLDVLNDTVCRIKHHSKYEDATQWVKDIIEEDEKTADRRNAMQ